MLSNALGMHTHTYTAHKHGHKYPGLGTVFGYGPSDRRRPMGTARIERAYLIYN